MLTHTKREKLLAGLVAAIMTTTIAGCGTDNHGGVKFIGPNVKPKGYVAPPNDEAEETRNSSAIVAPIYHGSAGYVNSSPSYTKGNSSKLGSTGTAGKSGIGSGMSRSSASAIS